MELKQPKLIGKDEDGEYIGRIEEIGLGYNEKKFFGLKIKNCPDQLMISNKKRYLWIFSIFNGYRQLGVFDVERPHDFKEGQDVLIGKKDDKIISVEVFP